VGRRSMAQPETSLSERERVHAALTGWRMGVEVHGEGMRRGQISGYVGTKNPYVAARSAARVSGQDGLARA
jgi:hypothetical protein